MGSPAAAPSTASACAGLKPCMYVLASVPLFRLAHIPQDSNEKKWRTCCKMATATCCKMADLLPAASEWTASEFQAAAQALETRPNCPTAASSCISFSLLCACSVFFFNYTNSACVFMRAILLAHTRCAWDGRKAFRPPPYDHNLHVHVIQYADMCKQLCHHSTDTQNRNHAH